MMHIYIYEVYQFAMAKIMHWSGTENSPSNAIGVQFDPYSDIF